MRATAEQEEIDGVHQENVYEMDLSVSCIDESVDSTSRVLVSVMMSASFVIEVETLRHQPSILPRNNGETHLHRTSAEDCQKHDPSDKSMYGTQDASHIGQLGCANHICGESGRFQRKKHSAALFYNPNQDVRHDNAGTLNVCWMTMDSNTSIPKSKDAVNDREEHLDSRIQT